MYSADTGQERPRLPALLRWAQATLLLLFLADTFTYSVLQPRHLEHLGTARHETSLAFSIYGFCQLATSLVLLLLTSLTIKTFPQVASGAARLHYLALCASVAVAAGSCLLTIIQPYSYHLLLLERSLQGTAAAAYSIAAMVLLADKFPLAWVMQAVAFMTAGQTLGDSIGPVVGAVLLDRRGPRAVSITTGALLTSTLPALAVLGVWWYRHHQKGLQLPRTHKPPVPGTPAAASVGSWTSSYSSGSACPASPGPAEGQLVLPSLQPCGDWVERHPVAAPCKAGEPWDVEGKDVIAMSDQWNSATPLVDLVVKLPPGVFTNGPCASTPSPASQQAPPQPRMGTSRRADAAAGCTQGSPEVSVWGLLKQGAVLRECGVVMATQLLHGVLMVLLPAAMSSTATWLLGVLLLRQAVGSVVSPFLLDVLLVWQPQFDTHLIQMAAVVAMAVAAVGAILSNTTLCSMVLSMTLLGAAQSVADALAFAHMVRHLQTTTNFSLALVTSGTSAFSLAYVLGGTVGPLVAAGPRHDPAAVMQQQLCVSAVAAVVLVYGVGSYGMHRKQQASKQWTAGQPALNTDRRQ